MYRVTCDFGTNQTTWKFSEALAWVAACGPNARITNRLTGRFVAGRA